MFVLEIIRHLFHVFRSDVSAVSLAEYSIGSRLLVRFLPFLDLFISLFQLHHHLLQHLLLRIGRAALVQRRREAAAAGGRYLGQHEHLLL